MRDLLATQGAQKPVLFRGLSFTEGLVGAVPHRKNMTETRFCLSVPVRFLRY